MPRNKPYNNFIQNSQSLHQMEVKGQLYALAAGLWQKELWAASYKIIVYWYSVQGFYVWHKYHTCMSLSTEVG